MPWITTLLLLLTAALAWAADAPPPSPQKPVVDSLHGVSISDPYRWLEEQQNPETRAWLEQQIAYTNRHLSALPGREVLRKKLEPMFRIDVAGAPVVRGGRHFFMRRLANENRMAICLREGFAGKTEVLISPESVSSDVSVSIGMGGISRDGKLMLYTVRQGGEDEVEVRFFDVDRRSLLADRMEKARYFGMALQPDGKGIYYSRLGKEGTKVMHHTIGSPASDDQFVFSKGTGLVPTDNVGITEDGRWLILGLNYGTSSRTEVRLKDLANNGPILDVATGIDAQFRPDATADRLMLWTNYKAPNWRVVSVPLSDPKLDKAVEVIPEREIVMSSFSAAGGRLYAGYLENVQSKVLQFDAAGKKLGEVAAPGVGTMSVPFGRWNDPDLFFTFSSFTQPGTVYRLNAASGKRDVWFEPKLNVDTSTIEARQVWYTSKDGTKVPMFLVHRKGLKLDGQRPTLLYGYGGFNISMTPAFNTSAVLWADLGGVYAVANLRGGGEFGENWHRAAMFEKKQNTFDDFIAAAEYLVQNKITKPANLAVMGGSNGGLLVGAMLTQRPDLVGAVLCSVPLLDMVRYDKFLLGKFWISEYGTADNPDQFKYLLKYSPYHHVEKGTKYPAVMFATGDADTRVDPLHARKMAALVQTSTASGKPVLLKYDTKAGHSGGKPVDQLIEDVVDQQIFLLNAVGAEIR